MTFEKKIQSSRLHAFSEKSKILGIARTGEGRYNERMMKKYVRILAALLALIMVTVSAVPAYAFDRDMALYAMRQRETAGDDTITEPITWMQGSVPYTPDRRLKAGNSGDRVGNGGCSYFAAAYMLLKMGQLDIYNGENPITVLDKMEAVKGWLTWGKMDYSRINEAYPDVNCDGYKKRFKSSDFHKQVQELRDLTKDGYFIIVCLDGAYTNGHYIFVDEILENDDLVIGDSAYDGTNWSDTHEKQGGYLVDYSIFKCKDVTPADTGSIYEYNVQEKLSAEAIKEAKSKKTVTIKANRKDKTPTAQKGTAAESRVLSSATVGGKADKASESAIELPGGKTLVVK